MLRSLVARSGLALSRLRGFAFDMKDQEGAARRRHVDPRPDDELGHGATC